MDDQIDTPIGDCITRVAICVAAGLVIAVLLVGFALRRR